MVTNVMKRLFIVATLVATSLLNAVVPEMEVWSDGNGNYRYLLHDWHVDYPNGKISIKQQEDFLWAVRQKDNAFAIVEDPLDYNNESEKINDAAKTCSQNIYQAISSNYYQDPSTYVTITALHGLSTACKQVNILCYNAECAQAINIFDDMSNISRQEVIDSLKKHIQQLTVISTYSANVPLAYLIPSYYRQLYNLGLFGPVSTFINSTRELRSDLVDAKTMHQLYVWHHKKHGFIFEGSAHIEKIKTALVDLGYKKMKHVGKENILDTAGKFEATERDDHAFIARTIAIRNALDLKKEFAAIFAEQEAETKLKATATTAAAATTAVKPPITSKL